MIKGKIESIQKDIESYRQAIKDAESALEAAEEELDEAMKSENSEDDPFPDTNTADVEIDLHEIQVQVTIDGIQFPATKYKISATPDSDEEYPF